MRLVFASYPAAKCSLLLGGTPPGESCVQVGVPPSPLALDRTHTSFGTLSIPLLPPPKMTIWLFCVSYTATWPARGAGGPPTGASGSHVGVPPTPFAFVKTQTSSYKALNDDVPNCPPPKMVIRLVPGSYTALRLLRPCGEPEGATSCKLRPARRASQPVGIGQNPNFVV